jgi:hypothetical protein
VLPAEKGSQMKKSLAVVMVVYFTFTTISASATPVVLEKKFSNCAALNKVYPGGVAKSAKWVNKGGKIKKTPFVNAKVYNENSSRDRDKDGIACEN